jgi:hypothetical protein
LPITPTITFTVKVEVEAEVKELVDTAALVAPVLTLMLMDTIHHTVV